MLVKRDNAETPPQRLDGERSQRPAFVRRWILLRTLQGLFGCVLAIGCIQAYGVDVRLAWDPSTAPDTAGYRISWGAAPGVYTNSIIVGNTNSATITGLTYGVTYYFAAKTRSNAGLESAFSNETIYQPFGWRPSPTRLVIQATTYNRFILSGTAPAGTTYEVQGTSNLKTWTAQATVIADANGNFRITNWAGTTPAQFFRLRQL